ncbi:MAG: B12-binding domain-containing radical SAM protein [Halioglobus sp.]|nr:B12-binding domain-containing radical SAM protein [Halioglobus sp.]
MSKLKVVLVNPPVFHVSEPWYDTPDFVRPSIAYLAAYLREHMDCDIKLIDCKFERMGFDDTLERIESFAPDIVAYTAFTNEIKPAAKVAQMVIDGGKVAPLQVVGGVHVTALPEASMEEFSQFDIVVYGEGELTFLQLCQAHANSTSLDKIDGLVFRSKNGQLVKTSPRERIVDINEIPVPAWDLLPPAKQYYLQASRGCPFSCKFCMNPNGKFVRHRSAESIIEEINDLASRYGAEKISYGDEIFTVNLPWVKDLLRKKIAGNVHKKLMWNAGTHVRFIDDELCKLMKESNCSGIGLGIETGSEEQLRKIGKGTTMEMMLAARECTRRAGLWVETFCILGQIDETVDTLKDTVDLVVKLNPELPIFGIMVPYPGTEVARLAAKGDGGYRIVSTDWDDYNKQIGGALEFAGLSRSQVEFFQMYAYLKVFIKNHRYKDLAKFCWTYGRGGFSIIAKNLKFALQTLLRKKPKESRQCEPAQIIAIGESMDYWEQWQRSELKRVKKEHNSAEKKAEVA